MSQLTGGVRIHAPMTASQFLQQKIGTPAYSLIHTMPSSVPKDHYKTLVRPTDKKPYATQTRGGISLPITTKHSTK